MAIIGHRIMRIFLILSVMLPLGASAADDEAQQASKPPQAASPGVTVVVTATREERECADRAGQRDEDRW